MYARDLTAEREWSRRTAIPYLSASVVMNRNTGSVNWHSGSCYVLIRST